MSRQGERPNRPDHDDASAHLDLGAGIPLRGRDERPRYGEGQVHAHHEHEMCQAQPPMLPGFQPRSACTSHGGASHHAAPGSGLCGALAGTQVGALRSRYRALCKGALLHSSGSRPHGRRKPRIFLTCVMARFLRLPCLVCRSCTRVDREAVHSGRRDRHAGDGGRAASPFRRGAPAPSTDRASPPFRGVREEDRRRHS